MPSKKRKFICAVPCPYCEKVALIWKEIEELHPAVKAEKEEKYIAEKEAQSTLPFLRE